MKLDIRCRVVGGTFEKGEFDMNPEAANSEEEKPSVTLPGTVEKIIPALGPNYPEKAQITVKGADDLYKEVRIENALEDENGNSVKPKRGAEVEVTIEANKADTTPQRFLRTVTFRETR
jgi:DNA repair exonuclease SbcCD nuclease subunit